MLVLGSLHDLLQQSIPVPDAKKPQGPHVAALIAPGSGALISLATMSGVARDDAKVLCALATEIWNQAANNQGKKKAEERYACGESEFGRVLVWPVPEDDKPPILLLALAGSEKADWDELGLKADQLAKHLAPAVSPLREKLAVAAKAPTQPKR